MTKPTRTFDGQRLPVKILVGHVIRIEGTRLAVRIQTVDGAPAGPEHLKQVVNAGTPYESETPVVYVATAEDRAGRPVPVKLGDPVTFVFDAAETNFLETRVNDVVTQSSRWKWGRLTSRRAGAR